MNILNFIFNIGVILAVYNFIWWLIMLVVGMIRGRGQKQLFEVYLIKAIRYLFLVDVIFVFVVEQTEGLVFLNNFLLAGLTLLFYFVGRIQSKQTRSSYFNVSAGPGFSNANQFFERLKPVFNMRYEILVLVLAFGLYSVFYFTPSYAYNAVANWFVENIKGIIDAPIFGFVFKVVGFFFLLNILLKAFNSVMLLLTGQLIKGNSSDDNFPTHNQGNEDGFDDYEEVE